MLDGRRETQKPAHACDSRRRRASYIETVREESFQKGFQKGYALGFATGMRLGMLKSCWITNCLQPRRLLTP